MKVRIIDSGFANFTGMFGSVEFVSGVSDDISKAEAERLGAILRIECADTGVNPSSTQRMVDVHNQNVSEIIRREAPMLAAKEAEAAAEAEKVAKVAKVANAIVKSQVVVPVGLDYSYTEDDLDAIVKREGIAGLRGFSEKYGVNGRSIASMIKELMILAAEHAPVAQPVEETEPKDSVEETLTEEQKIEAEAAAAAAADQE